MERGGTSLSLSVALNTARCAKFSERGLSTGHLLAAAVARVVVAIAAAVPATAAVAVAAAP
jgi:hypothetical protein